MILYHFPTSPFARRVRLALTLKGLSAELRDARGNPTHADELRQLNPLHTVPVLVDREHVLIDSAAILQYLDRKVPAPPLWPAGLEGAEAFQLAALADGAITTLIDLGMRYHALEGDPGFPAVKSEMLGRAQRALNMLGAKVAHRGLSGVPLCGDAWSAADMTVYTTVAWLEGLPARAAKFAPAKHIVDLGWSIPHVLQQWAAQHRDRADVVALG